MKGDSRLVGPALEAVQQRPISISSLLGNRCFFHKGVWFQKQDLLTPSRRTRFP